MQGRLIDSEPLEPIQEQLEITFDGDALKNHTFDTELYATSLLGFSQSFKKANKIIFKVDVDVKIEAEKEGSIESILQFLIENQQTAEVINTYAELFKNTAEGVGWTSGCIFGLYRLVISIIKKSKGKKEEIKKEIHKLNTTYELSQKLLRLFKNRIFRKGLDQLTYFLSQPNMDYIDISDNKTHSIRIFKSERPYFVEQPEDEESIDIHDTVVSIIYPSAQRTKWRFIIDGIERWAEVTYINFLKEMQDKPLEFFEDIEFSATIETTTLKKVDATQPEVTRRIFNFNLHTPPKQLKLPS